MKHVLAILFAALFATVAVAQDKKVELTPEQKLKGALVLANAGTALLVGPIALPAALLTGKVEGLCNVLGGTYTPNSDGKDQCPGGVWLRIIPYLGKD